LICYNCKKEVHVTLGCHDLLKCKYFNFLALVILDRFFMP
jgi:hypothetical protein